MRQVQRTVYALRYLADEAYRRRITRQLDEGQKLHSLGLDLIFAHDDTVRRRHHEQHLEVVLDRPMAREGGHSGPRRHRCLVSALV